MVIRFMHVCLIAILCLAALPALQAQTNTEDPVVFKVNDQAFTESEVLEEIDNVAKQMSAKIPAQMRNQVLRNKEVQFFQHAVSKLTNYALLKDVAEKKNITVSKEDIDAQIDKIKQQLPSPDVFEKALQQQGMTVEQFRKKLKEDLLIREVLDAEVKETAAPTDTEMKTFYDENPQHFEQPEQITASHILLEATEGTPAAAKEAKKEKLAEIKKNIESGEITFAEAAKQHSTCSSSTNGGKLGTFGKGQMVKPFEDVAFKAPVGQITNIVETQFGYHIIKVSDHQKGSTVPFDEAKGKISQHLQQQSDQEALQEYIKQLEEDADVEMVITQEEWKARHGQPAQPQAPSSGNKIKIDPKQLQ